jgi:hypothetical protein
MNKMRHLNLILAVVVLVVLWQGCAPEFPSGPDITMQSQNVRTWISSGVQSIDKEAVVSELINGKSGGQINYNLALANITVNGSLTIPNNAFEGSLELSALFNSRTTTQIFGPSPLNFRKPLLLTLEYRGVNLSGINPNEIDFYYIGSDNQFYRAEYSSIVVDVSQGLLKVVDAKLNHFSRWGWAK